MHRTQGLDADALGLLDVPESDDEPARRTGGRHDVDRAMTELLNELRIAQMGAQILLGFLLAVAYTSVLHDASEGDHALYAWAVVVSTGAVVLLLATVPLHRLNFGLRARPEILLVGHALSLAGLLLLAGAIVLSVLMAARMAVPGLSAQVVLPVVVLLVATWLGLPLMLRARARDSGSEPPG